jgi:hypothetical protein
MGDLGQAWVGISPDAANFGPKAAAAIKAGLAGVNTNIPLTIDQAKLNASLAQAAGKLGTLQVSTKALQSQLGSLRANVDTTAAEAKVAALQVRANSLQKSLDSAGPNTDLTRYEAQLLAIQAAEEKLASSTDDAGDEIAKVNIVSGNWFRTLTNIGGIGIPLFAGALGDLIPALEETDSGIVKLAGHLVNQTSGWHLMTEAVVESLALYGPAAIAITAFGLAATPTVIALGKQLQNMNTAATATGGSFKSLATSGESVTAAVRPSVMEAFGIALNTIHNSSGTLAPVLSSLGGAFDQLAAKVSVALSSAGGGKFFQQASQDALGLVQSFTSVGEILGSLGKAVPGYAEVLLSFGNAGLRAGADVVAAIEGVLAVFLKLHGAILYGGLAGTLGAKLFSGLVSGATAATEAVAGLAAKFLASDSAIVESLGNVLLGLDSLSAGPVIAGFGLIAGALAAVVLYMKAGTTAAQNFNSTIQQTVQNASALNLQSTISAGLAETYVQMATAAKGVATAQSQVASTSGNVQQRLTGMNTGVLAATQVLGSYKAGAAQLTSQQQALNSNLQELADTFHTSIPAALGLANGAQVTSNQLTATGASNTQTLNAQVAGYVSELGALTAGTGTLNNALNALNVTQSSQVSDIQKVTQAYSSYIGIVTGGDSAFTTFEQGQSTLSDELNAGSAAGVKLTTTSGKLTEVQKLLGTSMEGTSTSALAARQAFDSQITAATTLYGNLAQMAAVSGNTATAQTALASAGKDLVAQLLPMAKGSSEATAEVSALAQIVGGPATDSYQALQKWVGSTKNAEGDLDNQQTILTLSSSNLTKAAQNLATALSGAVTAGEAAAAAKAANLSQIQDSLAAAVENSDGKLTSTAETLAGEYYSALVKAGTSTTDAKDDVDAYLKSLGATPATVAAVNSSIAGLDKALDSIPKYIPISIVETVSAVAVKGTTTNILGEVTTKSASGGIPFPAYAGGGGYTVPGGIHGRDSQVALLAPGELVIPSSHAPKFRDVARKASVPGFASGGTAPAQPTFGSYGYQSPVSYASSMDAPTSYAPASATTGNQGLPPGTTYQAAQQIQLLQGIYKLLQQQPNALSQALSGSAARGLHRAVSG